MFTTVLWTLQILADLAIAAVLIRLLAERQRKRQEESIRHSVPGNSLSADDIRELRETVTISLEELKKQAEEAGASALRDSETSVKWAKRFERLEQTVRTDLRHLESRILKMESQQSIPARILQPVSETGKSEEAALPPAPSRTTTQERRLERPRTVREEIRDLHDQGLSQDEIAKKLHLGRHEVRLMIGMQEEP